MAVAGIISDIVSGAPVFAGGEGGLAEDFEGGGGEFCVAILAARTGWSLPRGMVLAPVAMTTHRGEPERPVRVRNNKEQWAFIREYAVERKL